MHDVDRDGALLRAALDARWPDAVGTSRATTDETHRVALVHPHYDGFLSLTVTARCHLDDGVFVFPDESLAALVTSHHRVGPLLRGQELPIDLELQPGHIDRPLTTGELTLRDASGDPVAPPVRLTLGSDASLDCVLAGAVDGPFSTPAELDHALDGVGRGEGSVRRLAQRITALETGRDDPGWKRRLPWRR